MKSNVSLKLFNLTFFERVGVAWRASDGAASAGCGVDRFIGNRIHPYYVVTMLLSGSADALRRFELDVLPKLNAESVSISNVDGTRLSVLLNNEQKEPLLSISVYAFDSTGLLGETTEVIRRHANAAGIAGATYSAAESGAPLFLAEFKVRLLPGASRDELEVELYRLADARGWDVRVKTFDPVDHRGGFDREFPPSRGVLDLQSRPDVCNPN